MSFATVPYDQLLLKLLSPDFAEREAADTVLSRLLMWPRVTLARQGGHMREALLAMPNHQAFVAELLDWFMHLMAVKAVSERWQASNKEEILQAWPAPAYSCFPLLSGGNLMVGLMAGQGMKLLFESLADLMEPQLARLERCLEHPQWMASSMADTVLTVLGPKARPALPALIKQVAESGWNSRSISLAPVIEGYVDGIAIVVDAIEADRTGSKAPQLFRELQGLKHIPAELLDRLFGLLDRQAAVELRRELLIGCAFLARGQGYRQAFVRYHALTAMASGEVGWSAHIATTLGQVGDPAEDEPLLLRLAGDADPALRMYAHSASAHWPAPSAAMLAVTAADLGDFSAYDEQPHYAAICALVAWGKQSLPVFPQLMAYFDADRGSGYAYELADVVEALGMDALPLKPVVERWLRQQDEPAEPVEERSLEEALADPKLELPLVDRLVLEHLVAEAPAIQQEIDARQVERDIRQVRVEAMLDALCIPRHEHIPGTEPGLFPEELDLEDRLKAWLQQLPAS